jgi:hypothetical protein
MLLRLWNTKVGVPDQSYYLHLAMQVKMPFMRLNGVHDMLHADCFDNFSLFTFFGMRRHIFDYYYFFTFSHAQFAITMAKKTI